MDAVIDFTQFVLQTLLSLIVWVVVAYAIMSWLISFDIVNLRNRIVYRISRFLEAVAGPLLAPFRRFLPTLGGMDFSPIILFVLIGGAQRYLLPPFFAWLHQLAGGGAAAGV